MNNEQIIKEAWGRLDDSYKKRVFAGEKARALPRLETPVTPWLDEVPANAGVDAIEFVYFPKIAGFSHEPCGVKGYYKDTSVFVEQWVISPQRG